MLDKIKSFLREIPRDILELDISLNKILAWLKKRNPEI